MMGQYHPKDTVPTITFWVLAMDQTLNVAPSLTLEQVEPHMLGMNCLLDPKWEVGARFSFWIGAAAAQ